MNRVKSVFDTGAYLERNPIIPIRARIVQRLLADVRNGSVLDLGCGDGSLSRPMLSGGNAITMLDFSERMIEVARRRTDADAPVQYVVADLFEFEPEAQYDAIICVGVLAHVGSLAGAIERVAGWLRSGGRCVLQITDDSAPLGWLLNRYYRLRPARYRFNTHTARELDAICRANDLRPIDRQRYGLLIPGLGLLPANWEARIETEVADSPMLRAAAAELLVSLQKA